MNKPNRKLDWIYWIFSVLLILFTFSETSGCNARLDSNYYGYTYGLWCPEGLSYIYVIFSLIFLLGLWAAFTLIMFSRAKKIEREFGIKKYVYVYSVPLAIAAFFIIYFFWTWYH